MSEAHALALEATAGIKAAQEELEQYASKLAVIGDPTAATAKTFAITAGALHQMLVDATLKIKAQQELTDRAIQDVREGARGLSPAGEADLVRRVAAAAGTATRGEVRQLARAVNRRTALMGAGLLVAVLLIGAVAGYGLRGYGEHLAAVTNCVPSPQLAGEAWTCTFWVRYPTPAQR